MERTTRTRHEWFQLTPATCPAAAATLPLGALLCVRVGIINSSDLVVRGPGQPNSTTVSVTITVTVTRRH